MTSEAADRNNYSNIEALRLSYKKILNFLWRLEKVSDIWPKWLPRWVSYFSFEGVCALSKNPSLSLSGFAQDLRTWVCHLSWPGKGDCQGQLVRGPCEPRIQSGLVTVWPIRAQRASSELSRHWAGRACDCDSWVSRKYGHRIKLTKCTLIHFYLLSIRNLSYLELFWDSE